MTTRPPAEIGMSLDEVDTPALVIDLDAFERNLRRLSATGQFPCSSSDQGILFPCKTDLIPCSTD